jgi:hypothetical protein
MSRSVIAAGIFIIAGMTSVSAEPLTGNAIKQLVSGKNVYLSTPYGLEFPLRYNTDGTVSGDASGFSVAGMLAPKETGSWWVKGPKLCQKWKSWYSGKTLCFTINKTGKSTISWKRDDGLAGTARIRG